MMKIISLAPQKSAGHPPEFLGWIFAAIGALFIIFGFSFAVIKFLTAKALKDRRSKTLIQITAGFTCLEVPYGTALGIFTFIVLSRPSVQQMFSRR